MPFSEGQFEMAWAVLEDRWNRKFSVPTSEMYRAILEEELTAEQFTRACRAAFRQEQFFPTPQRLIELGTGTTPESAARALWDAALLAIRAGERSTLSDDERTLLLSACHARNPADLDTKQLEWSRREFIARYAGHLRGESIKPKALTAPAMKELTNVSD